MNGKEFKPVRFTRFHSAGLVRPNCLANRQGLRRGMELRVAGKITGWLAVGIVCGTALRNHAQLAPVDVPTPAGGGLGDPLPTFGTGLNVEMGNVGGNAFKSTFVETGGPGQPAYGFVWTSAAHASSASTDLLSIPTGLLALDSTGSRAESGASSGYGAIGVRSMANAVGTMTLAGSRGGGTGAVDDAGLGALAGLAWYDTRFTGGAGETTINASLNLDLTGTQAFEHTYSASFSANPVLEEVALRLWVSVQYDGLPSPLIYEGRYRRAADHSSLESTVSEGLLLGFGGSATAASPWRIVVSDIPVPVDQPVTIGLILGGAAAAATSQLPSERVFTEMNFSHTLSLPDNGPVFTLPAGFTADAPSMFIRGNQFDLTLSPVPEGRATLAMVGLLPLAAWSIARARARQ